MGLALLHNDLLILASKTQTIELFLSPAGAFCTAASFTCSSLVPNRPVSFEALFSAF